MLVLYAVTCLPEVFLSLTFMWIVDTCKLESILIMYTMFHYQLGSQVFLSLRSGM